MNSQNVLDLEWVNEALQKDHFIQLVDNCYYFYLKQFVHRIIYSTSLERKFMANVIYNIGTSKFEKMRFALDLNLKYKYHTDKNIFTIKR